MRDDENTLELPPGWGPVVFLSVLVVLCNLGLGLWYRGTLLSAAGPAASALQPQLPGGPSDAARALVPPPRAPVAVQLDDALFTPELEAFVDRTAREHGIDPEQLPSAREMVEQMARSGLLPAEDELDLQAVLGVHIAHLAQQVGGTEDWQFPQPGAAPQ
jgi:hypothetical protein